ncbi:MAG TPA: glycosyltransferase family 2 protein [Candidatus Saccharimonas sp.]|nr:glycosyltransferase family 2 protein [Candidatus Saccharimonas sp.]
MSKISSLSLFFPMYNEAAAIGGTVERARAALDEMGIGDYEIILVDDGSRDGTGDLADSLAARLPKLKVVHHPKNLGYGAALSSGFAAATKDWVMYTDGDGQFDVSDLAKFLQYTDDYEVLLGYRLERQDHGGRKLNAALWAWLVWLLVGLRVRDLDCGFKLMRRRVLERVLPLEAGGAVISAELLLKLKRLGYEFKQIGVNHFARTGGKSTGANLGVVARAARELWQLRQRLGKPLT